MSIRGEESIIPVFSTSKMMPSPCGPLFNIDLLTPPSSDESVRPKDRCSSDTPRSHHTSSLNREFKKCRIYCDLTPIKEEELDKALKRSSYEEYDSPRKQQKRRNFKQACDKADNYETFKRKSGVNLTFCDASDEESKENSPIKITTGCGNSWTLQPPPRKLNTLTSGANGRKDILTHLHRRDLSFIIEKIFNELDPMDLIAVKDMSLNWRTYLMDIAAPKLEIAERLAVCRRENLAIEKKVKVISKSRNETTPLKTMNENRIPSPKRRIPQSPELSPASKRFCHYLREGKKLQKNERLERCPKCSNPARIVEALAASCSSCSYSFCSRCRSNPHPNYSCELLLSPTTFSDSPTSSSKRVPIGSKQSKKSLTRLL